MTLETHPSVVCTVLDQGGVLLHLETKFYYSLNGTGLFLWMLIEDGSPDPAGTLAARFPAESTTEAVREFLGSLEKEGLVRPGGAVPHAAGSAPPAGLSWEIPRLTRHDVPLNQIMSNPFDPAVPLAE